MANDFLARDIQAALTFGDLNILKNEIDWIENLLENFKISPEMLGLYLKQYGIALRKHLNKSAEPILEWFERQQFTG